MTNSRYLICLQWNSHFSRQRNSLCSASISRTLQTARPCSSSVFVKIKMSSKYTMTIPLAMTVQKTLFIMVWKVVGLLVIPKNITRGSKRLRLVRKAAFHSSPGLMCTLLKSQWTSSFVKYLAPQSWETSSEMRERGYLFLTVIAFSVWWKGQKRCLLWQASRKGSDSSQLHTKGFVRRRRKWGYQKEIKKWIRSLFEI